MKRSRLLSVLVGSINIMYGLSKSLDIKLSSNEAEAEDFDELAAGRVRDNQSI